MTYEIIHDKMVVDMSEARSMYYPIITPLVKLNEYFQRGRLN